jgi:phosphomannomutase/phosphoglucomutase
MDLNPDIFRQYDIRGTVGKDLTDETVSILGRSIGSYLCQNGATTVALAADNRLSSDGFRAIFKEELTHSGLHLLDVGTVPTPVLYYTTAEYDVDGGVMITGSHNPADFNGFKITLGGSSVYGKEIQKIREIADRGRYTVGKGGVDTADVREAYVKRLAGDVSIDRNLKVALDCGNGTAGIVVPDLMESLGLSPRLLFTEPDGRYPHHHPDPTVEENLESLIATVRKENLDVGIAYDGDADRIGVVDEKGEIIWGDRLLIILARDVISRNPGAKIIFDVKCSQSLVEAVEAAGGFPVMWKSGHSLIKEKMKTEEALLAGEMSGHIFFKERYYGYDDAIYASVRLLEIMSKSGGSLSRLLADVPTYHSTPEIRIECPDREKFEVVDRLKAHLGGKYKVVDIDGVRVLFDGGWGLVRASNTQPVLVLRFEAKSKELLQDIRQRLLEALREVAGDSINLAEA